MNLKLERKNILIVEDDAVQREKTANYFSVANSVVQCRNLTAAIDAVKRERFDVILLDVILPDGSGLKLMEYVADTPVVILSDLGLDSSILEGFTYGAADYVVKPASPAVIEARMALRLVDDCQAEISAHGVLLNVARRTALYNKKPLDLTSSEFNILTFLMQNAGTFFSASEIYERVWKMPYLNTTTIKAHLSNLRKKMLAAGEECGNLILTEFGKGYAFMGGGVNTYE